MERLLTLFKRFSRIVAEAFHNDPRFLTSRDKAFKRVVNDTSIFRLELPNRPAGFHNKTLPESKCPELLANYCDMLLRKTPLSKKLSSDEVEAKLRDVLLVLKYVQNKDVFMRYAKAHLTRRLILDTSADSEKEENMVEWLREVGMPADFINKLSRMFQDIKVSEDLNSQFKSHLVKIPTKQSLADTVSIKILNMGAWARTSERVPVTLPRELEDYIPEVEEFYKVRVVRDFCGVVPSFTATTNCGATVAPQSLAVKLETTLQKSYLSRREETNRICKCLLTVQAFWPETSMAPSHVERNDNPQQCDGNV